MLASKHRREHRDQQEVMYRCLNGPAEAAYCIANLLCIHDYSRDTIEDEVIIWTRECIALEQDTKIGGLPIREIYSDWPLRPNGERTLFLAQFDLSRRSQIKRHFCHYAVDDAVGERESKELLLFFFKGDSSSLFSRTPYLVISSKDIVVKRVKVASYRSYGIPPSDFIPEINADILPFELCGVAITLDIPLEIQQFSPVATRVFPRFIRTYENYLSDEEARSELGIPLLSFTSFDGESKCVGTVSKFFPFDSDFWAVRDFGPICIGDLWSIVVTEGVNNSQEPLNMFDVP